jgi:hypothetical protein
MAKPTVADLLGAEMSKPKAALPAAKPDEGTAPGAIPSPA